MSRLSDLFLPARRPLRHLGIDDELPVANEANEGQRRRRGLRLCLATEHVRLCLLPWSSVLRKRAHWSALARARFELLHGLPMDDWSVYVVDEPPPRPRLAVAVPVALLQRLGVGTDAAVAREIRIELLERLSALLSQRPNMNGMVLDVGLRGVTLAAVRRGGLVGLRQRSIGSLQEPIAGRAATLVASVVPTVIAEQAAAGLSAQPVLVAATAPQLQDAVCTALKAAGLAAEAWPC